jgi:uncharacterized protein involved in exopolysaccharide biosynthesis
MEDSIIMGDALKYFKVIRKWWWVIVLLCGVTVGTMAAIVFFAKPQYEATVTMQISAPPPQEAPLFSDFGRQLITDQIEQTRNGLSEFLQEGNAIDKAVNGLPEVNLTADEVYENILIDLPKGSQLMRVSIRASDPETAALLANTIVNEGLKLYGGLLARPTATTREFIEQQLEASRLELAEAEAALAEFQIANKVGALDRAVDDQYKLVSNLSQSIDLARADRDFTKAEALEEIVLEREIKLQNMIGMLAQYTALVDQVGRVRETHNFLREKQNEAQIKESQILTMGSIQIITPARPPRRPVMAIDGKLITLGAVLSIIAGILLSFFLEYLEQSRTFRKLQIQSDLSDTIPLPDRSVWSGQ